MNKAKLEQTFFATHQDAISEVFDLVKVDPEAAYDLNLAVDETQPWIKGDHVSPENELKPHEKHVPRLHFLFKALGLVATQQIKPGHYDHAVVLGGLMDGNVQRFAMLAQTFGDKGWATADNYAALGGERRINAQHELPAIDASLKAIRSKHTVVPWMQRLKKGTSSLYWETDLLRLAATDKLPGFVPAGPETVTDPFDDPAHEQHFTWQGAPFTLLHTASVDRDYGQARHTTECCSTDWVATVNPIEEASVAFITKQPHLIRTGRVFSNALREAGREDIAVTVGGPTVNPGAPVHLFLGEIARNLHEDQKLLAD